MHKPLTRNPYLVFVFVVCIVGLLEPRAVGVVKTQESGFATRADIIDISDVSIANKSSVATVRVRDSSLNIARVTICLGRNFEDIGCACPRTVVDPLAMAFLLSGVLLRMLWLSKFQPLYLKASGKSAANVGDYEANFIFWSVLLIGVVKGHSPYYELRTCVRTSSCRVMLAWFSAAFAAS